MNEALPHQIEAADRILAAFGEQRRRILVTMPNGTGRTAVVELVARRLIAAGTPVAILAQRKVEIEQIRHRIQVANDELGQSWLQFLTVAQLVKARGAGGAGLAGHAVIGINSSFAASFSDQTRVAIALDEARAIIGFTSVLSDADAEAYGESVYTLTVPDAFRMQLLSAPRFHSLDPFALSKRVGATAIKRGLDAVISRIDGGKCVFVCLFAATREAVYTSLVERSPGNMTVRQIADGADPAQFDMARDADWIVIGSSYTESYHVTGVRHVVLLDRFRDPAALLRAAQYVFHSQGGDIWDLADNLPLWQRLGMEGEPDAGADDPSGTPDAELPAAQKWVRAREDGAASHDLMGRERLIHVLRGIIRSKSQSRSLAIGLFGRWGSGKSTIIKLLRQRMGDSKNVVFIEFNAWENEQVSSMPAALADAITQQIYGQQSAAGRFGLLLKHRVLINDTLLSIALILVLGLMVAIIPVQKLDDKVKFSDWSLANANMRLWIPAVVTAFLALQVAWKSPFVQGLRSLLKQIGYAEHIGLARRLRDELASLFRARQFRLRDMLPAFLRKHCRIAPAKPSTYVVVIDDLDRCSRQNVWNVVEATRLIAEFREVVLVFAVDYRLLFDAIAERLHDKAADASKINTLSREFLAKILQLSVQLPEPSSASVARYIEKALFDDDLPAAAALPIEPVLPAGAVPEPPAPAAPAALAVEEPDEVLEPEDEYLVGTPAQAAMFQESAAAFGITNPRTLLRLYNSLTLIKGMHPEVGHDERAYRRHAFHVFLTELCAMHNQPMDGVEQRLSDMGGAPWRTVRDLAQRHGILEAAQSAPNRIAQQLAQTTSLPVL